MKLLENVVYSTKNNHIFKNMLFGEPLASGDRIRPLTVNEQVDYLYDLCCQPHSRVGDLAELCVAFPELQVQLVYNADHKNRDEIKFKLKFSLNYPDMP